jgi:hypothetical protein
LPSKVAIVRLPSSLIPQADVLTDVVRVLEAIKSRHRTYQGIAEYLGKVERQGRYYRLAAEILGLVKNRHNQAVLTSAGERLLRSTLAERSALLANAVLSCRIFQRVIPFLELHRKGVTRSELEDFMTEVTEPVGSSMMERRVSTVLSWLGAIHLIDKVGDSYLLKRNIPTTIEPIPFQDIHDPILPKAAELKEYEEVAARIGRARRHIKMIRDGVALERAHGAHRRLVNLVAQRLRTAGFLPRYNQLIDLAARVKDKSYLFEMKSLTDENARLQIRIGTSQLYEYRYLQGIPSATLVLVVEKALSREVDWMLDFLESDRGVRLLWDGDNELYALGPTKRDLSFLW